MANVINSELLIKEVHQRPAIWKSGHPQYKRKIIRMKMWKEIHAQFPEFSILELQKKWKNLKDAFRKELKKYSSLNSEPQSPYQSQWVHFQLLDFLRSECILVPDSVVEEEDNNNDDQSANSDNDTQENESANWVSNSPRPTLSKQKDISRKSKLQQEFQSEHLEIERKKLKILERELNKQSNEKHSDDYHFLMSIMPEMEKLHPIQNFRLRNKINQALMEEMTLAIFGDPLETITPDQTVTEIQHLDESKPIPVHHVKQSNSYTS